MYSNIMQRLSAKMKNEIWSGMANDGVEIDGWRRPLRGDQWSDWSESLTRKAFQTEGSPKKELPWHV